MSKQQEVTADSQSSATATSYRVLRELAKRSQRSFIAVRESTRERTEQSVVGPPPSSGSPLSSTAGGSLVVLNRFVRTTSTQAGQRVSQEAIAILLRDARCLEKNWHPNIARVRHVDLIGDTLSIATELLDGVTLADLFTLAKEQRVLQGPALILPPPVLARIFLDVLSGLAALHALRDGIDKPLSLFHGELCPANIVIGKDGVARVVNVFRPRPVTIAAASEALRYASPETLAGEVEQDARADIYAIGVMLWEALMGRPLYGDELPSRIAQRQREEDVPRPAGPLGDFAMRALSFDPALRFRTAQDAATHLRVASRSALATGSVVAQTVVDLAGDRIRSRRMELEPLLAGRTISGQRRAAQLGNAMQSGSHPIQPSGTPRSRPPMPPISFKEPASPPPPIAQPRPAAPSDPDVETSYAPRPLPARRPAAASVALRKSPPPLPVAVPAIPLPPESASAVPASRKLPPPLPVSQLDAHDEDDDDDDLPGPRGSTPDVNYLDELGVLAAAAAAAAKSSEEVIDAGDLIDDESEALAAARAVVVSEKSITPVPPALPAEASGAPPPPFSSAPTVVGGPSPLFLHTPSSPMTPRPIPRSDAPTVQAPTPFPEFPPVDQLTSRLSSTPPPPSFPKSTPTLHTSIERPAHIARPVPAPPPASERGAPTTRTPFVVDVLPLRPSVSTGKNALAALGDRRVVAIAIAIGTAAIVMLMVGAALIARRSGSGDSTSNASSRHEEQQQLESHPPSTVVVPPPTAVDTLPAASSKSPQK